MTDCYTQQAGPTAAAATPQLRYRGVKGWLIIPASLQPAWGVLWHLYGPKS